MLGDLFLVMNNIFPDTTTSRLDDNPLLDEASSFHLDSTLLNKSIEVKYAASTDASSYDKINETRQVVKKTLSAKKVGSRNSGFFRLF
jgi:hypothetical protein